MLPTSGGAVSPEFVTSALQAHLPEAVVTGCRPVSLTGDRGMAGGLIRFHVAGKGPGLPLDVVGKFPPVDPGARELLRTMRFFEREVHFYRTLAARTPVHTPTCYFADIDPDTGDAVLLLEDLSSSRNGSTVAGATVEDVTATLLALAQLHAWWWQDPTVVDQPWARLPSMLAPSAVAAVFDRNWPSFVSKLSVRLGADLSAVHAWIGSTLHEAATTLLTAGPRTLIHNDIHLDNLFFDDESGRPVIFVDWQMATYGRGVVDAAALIRSSLEPSIRRQAEPALVRLYHDALIHAGVRDYPLDQCLSDYDLATVLAPARLASAVGLHPGLHAHPGAPWDTPFARLSSRG